MGIVQPGRNPFLADDLFVGRRRNVADLAGRIRQGKSVLLIGGRHTGKTTLSRQLTQELVGRSLLYTNAFGWDRTTESTALGSLRTDIVDVSGVTFPTSTRGDVVAALEARRPACLILDEADALLADGWGAGFFQFLRWLDDNKLRSDLSIVLVGGPVLLHVRSDADRGSPPLNTAEPHFLYSLEDQDVAELAALGPEVDVARLIELGGGQAWLTTELLKHVWDGSPLDDAADHVADSAPGMFGSWERQLGSAGAEFVRRLPPEGLTRAQLRGPGWARHKESAQVARTVGVLRQVGDRLRHGPALFTDWFLHRDRSERTWQLAISYASDDEVLAREIYTQLKDEFAVFFAPVQAGTWGKDLQRALPNIYGEQADYILVLSTSDYVSKYWTQVEFDAARERHPERILLLDMGELPPDIPEGLVYRRGSPALMVGLIPALKEKLSAER